MKKMFLCGFIHKINNAREQLKKETGRKTKLDATPLTCINKSKMPNKITFFHKMGPDFA